MKYIIISIVALAASLSSWCQKSFFCQSRQLVMKEHTSQNRACLADNYLLWNSGSVLYIKFMNGSKALQDKVLQIGSEWEKYANLKFVYRENGETHIRILFNGTGLVKSEIALQANSIPQDEPTCYIDTSSFHAKRIFNSLVLHIYGHIIGLQHENEVPLKGRRWNIESLHQYAAVNNWNDKKLKSRIIEEYSVSISNSISTDHRSIMYYNLKQNWTEEKTSSLNDTLSQKDKQLIGMLYPFEKDIDRRKPVLEVNNFNGIRIEANNYGFSFYPKMGMMVKNVDRFQMGVFFFDEEDKPLPVWESDYSFDESLATVKGFERIAEGTYQLNYQKNDMGVYLPYSEIPKQYKGKRIKAIFKVFITAAYNLDDIKEFVSKPFEVVVP